MSYFAGGADGPKIVMLRDVEVPDSFFQRIKTGSPSLDLIFGGEDLPGIMPGTVILFSGTSGAGKTTTQLQLAEHFASQGKKVLYNIGEENAEQIKYTAQRIGVAGNFTLSAFDDVEDLCLYVIEHGIEVLFQDSLQSLEVQDDDGRPIEGMRAWTKVVKRFVQLKSRGVTTFAAGHVTKGGEFAGPNGMKHDVDVHAHFSINKDTGNRVLELSKNRFGPAGMPYEFVMTPTGMDFRAVDAQANAEAAPSAPKQVQKKEAFVLKVKELLLAGIPLSGYSHEDHEALRSFGVSGGYMRMSLQRAARLLEAEGHKIYTKTINRREHTLVEFDQKEDAPT